DACRETDQGVQSDEHHVEVVGEQEVGGRRPVPEQEQGEKEYDEAGRDIQPRRPAVIAHAGKHGGAQERGEKQGADRVERESAHRRSPRKRSSACISTVSNRSRMRNRKMPMTMKAIRTEKATLISTTRGIPRAPVPA